MFKCSIDIPSILQNIPTSVSKIEISFSMVHLALAVSKPGQSFGLAILVDFMSIVLKFIISQPAQLQIIILWVTFNYLILSYITRIMASSINFYIVITAFISYLCLLQALLHLSLSSCLLRAIVFIKFYWATLQNATGHVFFWLDISCCHIF